MKQVVCVSVPNVPKASDVHAATLAERKKRGELGLSAWIAESSEHLGTLKGEIAAASYQEAVGVASVMAKIYPEKQQEQLLGIAFFQIERRREDDGPIIDVEGRLPEQEGP